MDRGYLIKKLEERKMDLQEEKRFWDSKAEEIFTYLFDENKQERPIDDGSVEYLKQFIDFKGKSVLDVGFGTGGHLELMWAEGAAELCGVEMTDKMLECAKRHFMRSGMDADKMELHNLPWEDIDLDELNWRNKFDLVFASKTPVLNSYASIQKMIEASKKGIFFATHVDITEDILSEVHREIHGKEYDSQKTDFLYLLNILYLDGYYANIKIDETKQKAEYPTDILVSRYIPRIFPEGSGKEPDKKDLDRLKKLIKKHEVNGKVPIVIMRKVALIYFEK